MVMDVDGAWRIGRAPRPLSLLLAVFIISTNISIIIMILSSKISVAPGGSVALLAQYHYCSQFFYC